MESLLKFQNIESYDLKVEGDSLTGKSYELRFKQFQKGKKQADWVLIDSAELGDLGKIKAGELSFKILSQTQEGKSKIEVQFPRFNSSKTFKPVKSEFDYVMKDFLGGVNQMPLDAKKENYFLAYLLPTEHKDGSASYCEVAQSGLDPETLYEKFKVPNYYLVSIRFKN